jgi:hypothetical protein
MCRRHLVSGFVLNPPRDREIPMNRRLPLSLLTAVFLFAASEAVVRVFFARNMSGRFEYGYDATAGFVEHGDDQVDLVRAGGRRFWPQSFSRDRPAGTFRIMVIGDSVPRAASLKVSYAFRIGEELRNRGIPVESLNLCVAGNGALRNQIVLRQALNYQPSLIILHVNNSNEFEDERDWKRAEAFRSWHPRNWPMKSLVVRRLYEMMLEKVYWELVPAEVRNLHASTDLDDEAMASRDPAKRQEWEDRVRRFTAESIALSRAHGVPILLVSQARLDRSSQGTVGLDDHGLDALVRSLAGPGVIQLSMKETLSKTNFAPLYADTSHLYPPGHEVMAAAIIAKLFQEGIMKGQ